MDVSVAILLTTLYKAAEKIGVLEYIAKLPEKSGDAIYQKLLADKAFDTKYLRKLFEPNLDRMLERAFEKVAPKNKSIKRHFLLRALSDPELMTTAAAIGRGELPTRSELVPLFRDLLAGDDPDAAADRFVEALYAEISGDQKLVNRVILLLSERETERAQAQTHYFEVIIDMLRHMQPGSSPAIAAPAAAPLAIPVTRLELHLGALAEDNFTVALLRNGDEIVPAQPTSLTPRLRAALAEHRQALAGGHYRGWAMPRYSPQQTLELIGGELGTILLPGTIATEVVAAVEAAKTGPGRVELTFTGDDATLLSLPLEATHHPSLALPLALLPGVAIARQLPGTPPPDLHIPGPLRILVLIGSPDEATAGAPLLDLERELRTIIDAVDQARRGGTCIVEILEEGTLANLKAKLDAEPFHVLHISCHARPGTLILEDQDGNPAPVSATKLAEAVAETAHPYLPLVVLAACQTGVAGNDDDGWQGQSGSFAAELLQHGVPAVLAMQHPVGDWYATELAGKLYRSLADDPVPAPLWALAKARREVEHERRKMLHSAGDDFPGREPEYATPALYLRPGFTQLFDRARPFDRRRPERQFAAIPGLCLRRIGDFIGRRRQQRRLLRWLHEDGRAGVLIHGMGGSGKSALAAHLAERLVHDGWLAVTWVGPLNEIQLCDAIGVALAEHAGQPELPEAQQQELAQAARVLRDRFGDDDRRRRTLFAALQRWRLLLLLDNFEDNLDEEAKRWRDPELPALLCHLLDLPLAARFLLTCRYPLPGLEHRLHPLHLEPLSRQETRKLMLRLPAISRLTPEQRDTVYRQIGGHPRLLEYLDGLLNAGQARFAEVSERLESGLRQAGIEPEAAPESLDEAMQRAAAAGAQDILLERLIALAQQEAEHWQVLLGAAVFEVPVPPAALAWPRWGQTATPAQRNTLLPAARRLAALSLLTLAEQHCFVHRWSAAPLLARARADELQRCHRGAAAYWRAHGSDLQGLLYAVSHLLQAGDYSAADDLAWPVLQALKQRGRYGQAYALNAELLANIPEGHAAYPRLCSNIGDLLLGLGQGQAARQSYEQALAIREKLAAAEPDRADYARDLSVSYNKLGDLLRGLGQGQAARQYYEQALAIREKLAAAEPDRADYARDLYVSCFRMGDLYLGLGAGEKAKEFHERALQIAEKLHRDEPDRVDFVRDLSMSYNKLGDLLLGLGQGQAARQSYEQTLAIREKLAAAEPDRADYARDLSVSCERMGDLLRGLGQGQAARQSYEQALAIREKLAAAEPDRADYARDLSVSYNKLGDLLRGLGQGQAARQYYEKDLAIAEKLAAAEPDRADYARDLYVSCFRMGDLYLGLGAGEKAKEFHERALQIAEKLHRDEPDRVDFVRDLSMSYNKMGDLLVGLGQGQAARQSYEQALAICEKLAAAEPDRADYARDLSVSYERMGDLLRGLGQGQAARQSYEQALAIREKLAAAEPNLLERQLDLVVSYYKLGTSDSGVARRDYLERALTILHTLQQAGTLPPANAAWIDALQQELAR